MIYQFTTFEPPLGVQPGASTPNCFEYSATNRCQPANFMASTPAMAPIGFPTKEPIKDVEADVPARGAAKDSYENQQERETAECYWLCFRRWFP
jgi:hypothetical protein